MTPMAEHGHGKISEMDQANVFLEAAEPGVLKWCESPDDEGSKDSGITVTFEGGFRRPGNIADQPIVINGVNDTDARFRPPRDTVDQPIIIDGVTDTKARNLNRKRDDTSPGESHQKHGSKWAENQQVSPYDAVF